MAGLDHWSGTNPTHVADGIKTLADEAVRRGVHLWIGVCQQRGGEWFNEAIGLLADGTRITYRKVNLATAERARFRPGEELRVFEVPFASGPIEVGVQLCRELRFPEQWRWLAERGARLFLHLNHGQGDSTAFETWRSLLIARAAENQRFLASANAASASPHCPSMAVAPDGAVVLELSPGSTDVKRADLDLDRTADWYLGQRRSDLGL